MDELSLAAGTTESTESRAVDQARRLLVLCAAPEPFTETENEELGILIIEIEISP
jgi:hypothetical protein